VTFPQPGRKFGKLQLPMVRRSGCRPSCWAVSRRHGRRGGDKQQTGARRDARHVTIVTTGPMQAGMAPPCGNSYGLQATDSPLPSRPPSGQIRASSHGFMREGADADSSRLCHPYELHHGHYGPMGRDRANSPSVRSPSWPRRRPVRTTW
jgi:hypothetical protein